MSDVSQFLKCPNCHRTTVTLTHHVDGDISIDCEACGEHASGMKLHEHDRVHSYKHEGTTSK